MKKSVNNLYKVLTPLLDKGADEGTLSAARKQHRKEYKAAWQKAYRSKHKSFTVAYTSKEFSVIKAAAKGHHRSITKFIAEAALAYCSRQYLVMDTDSVRRIKELLVMNYTALQQLCEESPVSRNEVTKLLTTIATLETNIMTLLQRPQLVEEDK